MPLGVPGAKIAWEVNLFPPNVPMWEHDLKENFLGFSFEQFFSKLVPHLEQMFSPLSVKKYNF